MKKQDEFYIGWMPVMPDSYSRQVKRIIVLLVITALASAFVLVWQEEKFSTAIVESPFTEVKGIFQKSPVPSLKVISPKDILGNQSYITIPLVGYGKSGAEGTIAALEHEKGIDLDNKEVILKGILQYSDGKTLLQIDKHDNPLVSVSSSNVVAPKQDIKDLGSIELKGEIIDPKCYFGAMKPGHSKPHRDCAIRCIEGGMDPILYVKDEQGHANYYLILGPAGEKLNKELKDHVAEPVAIQAKAMQHDDWIVLYLDPSKDIKRIGGLSWFKSHDGSVSCGPAKQ